MTTTASPARSATPARDPASLVVPGQRRASGRRRAPLDATGRDRGRSRRRARLPAGTRLKTSRRPRGDRRRARRSSRSRASTTPRSAASSRPADLAPARQHGARSSARSTPATAGSRPTATASPTPDGHRRSSPSRSPGPFGSGMRPATLVAIASRHRQHVQRRPGTASSPATAVPDGTYTWTVAASTPGRTARHRHRHARRRHRRRRQLTALTPDGATVGVVRARTATASRDTIALTATISEPGSSHVRVREQPPTIRQGLAVDRRRRATADHRGTAGTRAVRSCRTATISSDVYPVDAYGNSGAGQSARSTSSAAS